MAGREINIPEVGPATMFKRRRMRNVRIVVNARGQVRINLPRWVPYKTGERFAVKNRQWIKEQLSQKRLNLISAGDIIGRGGVVEIERVEGSRTTTKVSQSLVRLRTPLDPASEEFQKKARAACEKCLKIQAEACLPDRLAELADSGGFRYNRVTIKKLHSRWGSCSLQKNINLSVFMMQLPDELVDYVILHELVHTEQMNHGPKFWARMEEALPGAKTIRRQLRKHQPHLVPGK